MKAVRDGIDKTLGVLKWPVGIVTLLLLPGSVWAWSVPLGALAHDPFAHLPFWIGLVGYWVLWLKLFRKRAMGSMFSTFEHEFTHAIFAWLTLHWVTGLRATWSDGGVMKFKGEGNFLIASAPYWFPTIAVALALVIGLVPDKFHTWAAIFLGVAYSYHLTSTYRETHRQQTDLQIIGFPFACVFLPAVNVFSYGVLLSVALGGHKLALEYAKASYATTASLVARFAG